MYERNNVQDMFIRIYFYTMCWKTQKEHEVIQINSVLKLVWLEKVLYGQKFKIVENI